MTGPHELATSVRGLDPGLHVQDTEPLAHYKADYG